MILVFLIQFAIATALKPNGVLFHKKSEIYVNSNQWIGYFNTRNVASNASKDMTAALVKVN